MSLLYSSVPPLKAHPGQETINEAFHRLAHESDEISIAVGYVSRLSLEELQSCWRKQHITGDSHHWNVWQRRYA